VTQAEPIAPTIGGRDDGLAELLVAQRSRRCWAWLFGGLVDARF
jgi:hypothetical protein